MASAKVKVNVDPLAFADISALAGNVITGLTANPVLYPAPHPTTVTLISLKSDIDIAIANWGPVHNRGSHADYLDLVAKAFTMRANLFLEAAYIQGLVNPADPWAVQAAFITPSGFSVKNLPTPQGLLGVPQNLHQVTNSTIATNTPMIKWNKPLGLTSPNNVKSYEVFRSNVNIQPLISIASVTSTKYLDLDVTIRGTQQFYWIQALNDAGLGAPTASLLVSIPV
jgi:hypothetical protein